MNSKHFPTALVGFAALLATATCVSLAPASSDERAEIKMLVQRDKVPEAMAALKLTETANKHYQIYFVDIADFRLNRGGLILRLRDKGKGKTESTVKFRPEDPSKPIDQEWLPKLA